MSQNLCVSVVWIFGSPVKCARHDGDGKHYCQLSIQTTYSVVSVRCERMKRLNATLIIITRMCMAFAWPVTASSSTCLVIYIVRIFASTFFWSLLHSVDSGHVLLLQSKPFSRFRYLEGMTMCVWCAHFVLPRIFLKSNYLFYCFGVCECANVCVRHSHNSYRQRHVFAHSSPPPLPLQSARVYVALCWNETNIENKQTKQ